jgi:ESS family glutamate:Na+ symporter
LSLHFRQHPSNVTVPAGHTLHRLDPQVVRQFGRQHPLGKLHLELAGQARLAENRFGILALYLSQQLIDQIIRIMGRNYDAAVLAAGHCGFGLGATPTAIANMQAITERFGPSHLAFLVVPMVGAFFIDIANAIVIELFLLLPIYR